MLTTAPASSGENVRWLSAGCYAPQKVHSDKEDGAGEAPPELRGKDRQASARALSKREEALEAATTRPQLAG